MRNLHGIIFVLFMTQSCESYLINVPKSQDLNRPKRHNAKVNSYRWQNATVPYRIDMMNYTLDHIIALKNSMEIIENKTCVKFIDKTNEEDFVTITGDSYHCGTKIGRRGGEQILSILPNKNCFRTVAILHELLHVLGFSHMHLSANRDEFVKILWRNVKPEKWSKFRIRENLQDLNIEYDYSSILHYSEYAHSKNGKKTMRPLKNTEGVTIGQSSKLSDKDIMKINRLYDCNEIPHDQ